LNAFKTTTDNSFSDIITNGVNKANHITNGTTGDLLYQSASNTTSKLSIGTTGQLLVVNGSVPVWSNDISANGNIYGKQIGYTSYGSVSQDTDKSTAVTLDLPCGRIDLSNAELASNISVNFDLNNNKIADGDVLILNQVTGTLGSYLLNAACTNGKATISVRNLTGVSLSETISIQYALIKGSS
jgi:hypothetical protein